MGRRWSWWGGRHVGRRHLTTLEGGGWDDGGGGGGVVASLTWDDAGVVVEDGVRMRDLEKFLEACVFVFVYMITSAY